MVLALSKGPEHSNKLVIIILFYFFIILFLLFYFLLLFFFKSPVDDSPNAQTVRPTLLHFMSNSSGLLSHHDTH